MTTALESSVALKVLPQSGQRHGVERRNEALDVARLVAAWAIIWIHAGANSSTVLARFAVPFFTCMALFLVAQKAQRESLLNWPAFALSRARRLYLPFLAWSTVYLLFKLVKKALLPEAENDFGGWEMLVWGGAYHLWFLPFILLASVLTFLVGTVSVANPLRRLFSVAVFAVAAICLACWPCPQWWPGGDSGHCVWQALPAAAAGCCWGMLAGTAAVAPPGRRKARWLAAIAVFVSSMGALALFGRSTLLETAAGFGLAVAALYSPAMHFPALLPALGRLAYGIYCSHLLFIKLGESLAGKLHLPQTSALDIGLFLTAAMLSAACAWLLSLTRATRWLVA